MPHPEINTNAHKFVVCACVSGNLRMVNDITLALEFNLSVDKNDRPETSNPHLCINNFYEFYDERIFQLSHAISHASYESFVDENTSALKIKVTSTYLLSIAERQMCVCSFHYFYSVKMVQSFSAFFLVLLREPGCLIITAKATEQWSSFSLYNYVQHLYAFV